MANSCGCLIPFYNEGNRIFKVLEVVAQLNNLAQVVVVDDGSQDQVFQELKTKYPQFTLLRLEQNQGKTAAVKHGLSYLKTDLVLLLDADLKKLKAKELETAVASCLGYLDKIDLLILKIAKTIVTTRLTRGDILLSGCRILKVADLRQALKQKVNHYQLEVAINHYMIKQDKTAYWFKIDGRNTYKILKRDLKTTIEKEIEMYRNILEFFTDPEDIKHQVFDFCQDELPDSLRV